MSTVTGRALGHAPGRTPCLGLPWTWGPPAWQQYQKRDWAGEPSTTIPGPQAFQVVPDGVQAVNANGLGYRHIHRVHGKWGGVPGWYRGHQTGLYRSLPKHSCASMTHWARAHTQLWSPPNKPTSSCFGFMAQVLRLRCSTSHLSHWPGEAEPGGHRAFRLGPQATLFWDWPELPGQYSHFIAPAGSTPSRLPSTSPRWASVGLLTEMFPHFCKVSHGALLISKT